MRINHTGHDHPATPAARAACRKNANDVVLVALADAVDARRALDAHRKVRRDNNPTWRRLSLAAMRTAKAYADLAGMTPNDAADKIRTIAEIPVVNG